MRAARYHGPHDVRIEEISPDPLGPDAVRIDVAACGICGSDLHAYEGEGSIPEEPHPVTNQARPVVMGHEVGGTVVETGERGSIEPGTTVAVNPLIWCGDCRYCSAGDYNLCDRRGFVGMAANGGFAETLVVSAEKVVPVPAGISAEMAALVEPFAVSLHAVRRSPIRAGDSVAVFGAGPIGLAAVQAARASGAGTLFVSEPRRSRRDLAKACGADVLIDPTATDPVETVRDATGGGVDVSLEVAGVPPTVEQAIQATASGGWTTIVSLFTEPVSVQPNHIVTRERTITGSAAYQGGPLAGRAFGRTLRHFETGLFDPELVVTGRIPIEGVVEDGIEPLLDPDSEHVKILVTP